MSVLIVNDDTMSGACGVSVFYDFGEREKLTNRWGGHFITVEQRVPYGGAGLICAGFIYGDILCDKIFEALANKYDVLFVSEPRHNRNSGNKFYMAVFSVKDLKKDKYGFNDADSATYDDVSDDDDGDS